MVSWFAAAADPRSSERIYISSGDFMKSPANETLSMHRLPLISGCQDPRAQIRICKSEEKQKAGGGGIVLEEITSCYDCDNLRQAGCSRIINISFVRRQPAPDHVASRHRGAPVARS